MIAVSSVIMSNSIDLSISNTENALAIIDTVYRVNTSQNSEYVLFHPDSMFWACGYSASDGRDSTYVVTAWETKTYYDGVDPIEETVDREFDDVFYQNSIYEEIFYQNSIELDTVRNESNSIGQRNHYSTHDLFLEGDSIDMKLSVTTSKEEIGEINFNIEYSIGEELIFQDKTFKIKYFSWNAEDLATAKLSLYGTYPDYFFVFHYRIGLMYHCEVMIFTLDDSFMEYLTQNRLEE